MSSDLHGTRNADRPSGPASAVSPHVDRAEIVAMLQTRGLHDRAEWVERALPPVVDTHENGSLLRMLGIDPAAMSPVDGPPPAAAPGARP